MQPVTPQGWREPALAGSAQRPAQVPQAQQAPQRSSRAPHSSQSQGTQGPQRPAKPRRKSRVLPFLMILVLVATLCVGSYVFIIYRDVNRQADVFYDGVFASGVHLGGMTQQEAYDALAAVEQQKLAEWKVDITYNATLQSLTAADIDLQLKLPDQIAAAWVIGREGDLFTRWRTINALRTTPSSSEGGIFYSAEKLDRILQLIQEGITAEAKNAEVVFSEEDKTFVFTREEYGATLDVEPIRAQIEKSITTLSSSSVQLQPEEVAPAITLADLESEHALIVSVSTPINKNSEEGRNQNVRLALSRIDGLRIDPGKKFSFNDTVGKRTEKNGFQPAKEIESGEYTIGIGGGVCQVSTTLYQAVVRAGLKIDKREPHAIPSNYSEMGQDATVSDGRIDFVFRNNSSAPIYIVARFVDGKQKKCVVEIYGKPLPDGISYVLESRQVGVDIEPDVPIEYRKDKKQEYVVYSDKEYELSPKRLGHKIQTYLVALRSDGLEIDRKLITTDVYQPKPAIVYVGTTTR